MKYSRQEGQFV